MNSERLSFSHLLWLFHTSDYCFIGRWSIVTFSMSKISKSSSLCVFYVCTWCVYRGWSVDTVFVAPNGIQPGHISKPLGSPTEARGQTSSEHTTPQLPPFEPATTKSAIVKDGRFQWKNSRTLSTVYVVPERAREEWNGNLPIVDAAVWIPHDCTIEHYNICLLLIASPSVPL